MSRTFLCLECWRRVGTAEALVECPRCLEDPDPWSIGEEPRRPAREIKVPFWRRLLEDRTSLTCGRHGSAYQYFCPCGERLREGAELKSERPMAVGLAGSKAAGKSHLLVAMIDSLQRVEEPKVGLLGLGDTEGRFEELSQRVLRDGKRLPPTPPGDETRGHFAWEVLVEGPGARPRSPRLLAVHDLAGETWERLADEPASSLARYLEQLGSLALLLDGATMADDLDLAPHDAWDDRPRPGDHGAGDRKILRHLIERLAADRGQRPRLALVISKADLLWGDERFRGLDPTVEDDPQARAGLVRDLLERSGRQQLLLAAEKHFREVGLFAVSSFGFRPDANTIDAETGRRTEPLRPQGVTELLLWLLRLPGQAGRGAPKRGRVRASR